ncbi:NUDIX hydrolase [Arsenicicoccus dermatophilus]|uniref:NUDIX hydrolase n=1 Tax=Arsenicicoccus dermatophilus TaxID=1076331 RepID=UPI001F4C9ECC|nr:NUDIX domain-containing protein [Arsenicicoccus dermatophilus]MCH8611795.1 NUDIX domain-containing protein [Arsenicicoccus dermatophilus]
MTAPHPAVVDGVITVAALVVLDDDGRLLTVRKEGTERFMLPGGKLEPGETPARCASREAAEEVGVVVPVESLVLLDEFTAAAANEPGHQVRSTVYVAPRDQVHLSGPPQARGEIAEIRWLDMGSTLPDDLAPLLRDAVVPALTAGGPRR